MKPYAALTEPKINNLLLIGAGLIGGSLTLALKKSGVVRHIVGVGRSAAVMDEAVALGVVDVAVRVDTPEFIAAIQAADVIVLAMPVGQTRAVLDKIRPTPSSPTSAAQRPRCTTTHAPRSAIKYRNSSSRIR